MENVITEKRGLVIILVIATILIFVGFVWVIANYLPLNILGAPNPSDTANIPVAGENCTHPVTYWQDHPELYPGQLVIGGKVYRAKDIGGIFSDESEDPAVQLEAQLTGAYLNFLAGADLSSIETSIFEAYGWLVQHPAGSELTNSAREAGSRLINILAAYNTGSTAVAACEPGINLTSTETSSATLTPSSQFTLTSSATVTATPSETTTPTNFPTVPFSTEIQPTRTPSPTTGEREVPTVTPSRTPEPSATNTAKPTDTPGPTDTLEPPTATFTQPATDTPTPTHPPLE